jgi:Cu/Ag efflux protein CusF
MKLRTSLSLVSLLGAFTFAASNAVAHCGSCGVGDEKADHAHSCPVSCEEDCCAESGNALTGEVVSVKADKHMVVVKHDEIEGVMKAMTMGFAVPENYDLSALKKGDHIKARMVSDDNGYMIKFITVVDPKA